MKAEVKKPTFQPITLTLETEAEAKAIYAVLNHPILCGILGLEDLSSPSSIGFPDMDSDTESLHVAISSALRK